MKATAFSLSRFFAPHGCGGPSGIRVPPDGVATARQPPWPRVAWCRLNGDSSSVSPAPGEEADPRAEYRDRLAEAHLEFALVVLEAVDLRLKASHLVLVVLSHRHHRRPAGIDWPLPPCTRS